MTPDVFLEMAGGILHSLSYQQVQPPTWAVPSVRHRHVRLHLMM